MQAVVEEDADLADLLQKRGQQLTRIAEAELPSVSELDGNRPARLLARRQRARVMRFDRAARNDRRQELLASGLHERQVDGDETTAAVSAQRREKVRRR